MTPSIPSMVDEILLIKLAEESTGWKFPTGDEWKRLAQVALAHGIAMGIGAGAGYAVREKILKKALPHMSDPLLALLSTGGGAALALASSAAMKKGLGLIQKKSNEPR